MITCHARRRLTFVCCPRAMMECLARCRLAMFGAQGTCGHAMPDVVWLCVKSKDDDSIKHSTFCNCMWCTRSMMSCHTRHRLCVYHKGDNCMPHPMSCDHMFCPKAMMSCHAWCSPTVCDIQGKWLHATPNIVRPFVLPYDADGMPRPTSCDHMHLPKAMVACHALRVPIVFVVQGRW